MLSFSVVIPTRGQGEQFKNLLRCIQQQTLKPDAVYLVVDRKITIEEKKNILAEFSDTHIVSNLDFDFEPYSGVSYVRNYGLSLVKNPYTYFLDDDNTFEKDFFEHSFAEYQSAISYFHHDIVLSPRVMYRNTGTIQSLGMRTYVFALAWPWPRYSATLKAKIFSWIFGGERVTAKKFLVAQMIGGNSLLGKSEFFKKILFDEHMGFVFEDLDFTYRCFLNGSPVVVSHNLSINHQERDKSAVEKLFLSHPDLVYRKIRNKIIFVKKVGTQFQKIEFFVCGLRLSTLWTLFALIKYGKCNFVFLTSLGKGIVDGIVYKSRG